MNVKKLRYFAFALIAVAFCACQKEPSTSDLHRDYLVYTAHDTDTDFAAIDTYYLPDSILVIGNSDKTEYWKDADALEIIGTVAGKMNAAGYTRTDDKDAANVGIQLSYVRKVTYFVGYDYPYWCGTTPTTGLPDTGATGSAGTTLTAFITDTRPVRCCWRCWTSKPIGRATRNCPSCGTASSAVC